MTLLVGLLLYLLVSKITDYVGHFLPNSLGQGHFFKNCQFEQENTEVPNEADGMEVDTSIPDPAKKVIFLMHQSIIQSYSMFM